jgi:hypothetical protein
MLVLVWLNHLLENGFVKIAVKWINTVVTMAVKRKRKLIHLLKSI